MGVAVSYLFLCVSETDQLWRGDDMLTVYDTIKQCLYCTADSLCS